MQRSLAVHPHARGEHPAKTGAENSAAGSSPRTWGTLVAAVHRLAEGRFIPTHVGNTLGLQHCGQARPVHPHARGEHVIHADSREDADGSSPRTWGTLCYGYSHTIRDRFIPTHVGNTIPNHQADMVEPVHPHARGEHLLLLQPDAREVGSSPRTWGTLVHLHRVASPIRFIPTHVGNTSIRIAEQHQDFGSSPRTWGTPGASCASAPATAVHPHARGEHFTPLLHSSGRNGSSPRTWGTRSRRGRERHLQRFIPTHVGNTSSTPVSWAGSAVHPHARGEHVGQW